MLRLATLVLLSCAAVGRAAEFSPADIVAWPDHGFSGQTRYSLVTIDAEAAVHADCADSASGLVLERRIDLAATPVIEWRWRVTETFPADGRERQRDGDDFPARLYVVRDGGLLRWRTRAVNYVWASEGPAGADWPNPFASQARMVALRVGVGAGGGWHTERRNIREDFRRFHDLDLDTIDAVAVMTDCDNRGTTAQAWYGTIRFLPDDDADRQQ